MNTSILRQINWRQPKYMIPAIIYIPLLFTGYFAIDMFHTDKLETVDTSLKTTHDINAEMPGAKIKDGDGIGSKYENMTKAWGKIGDMSAVESIDRDNPDDNKEQYESKYTQNDIALLDQQEKDKQMAAQNADAQASEKAALQELEKALTEARLKGQQAVVPNASPNQSETSSDADNDKQVNEKGKVDVVFYPVLEQSPLAEFGEAQQKQLLSGKAILADMTMPDGKKSAAFVQIDTETKQVMFAPTPVIGRNLQVLAGEMKLSNAEVKVLQGGEPLTFVMEDEPVTVGIDLNANTGIRLCQGAEQRWREQAKREWDKYTFGCYGCWVTDDDGNLSYVSEDDYTEELWNEQKKAAGRAISHR